MHRVAALAFALAWALHMVAHIVTGLYNPAFHSLLITSFTIMIVTQAARMQNDEWPLDVVKMLIGIAVLHLFYWTIKRIYGSPDWQMTYQHCVGLIEYLCLLVVLSTGIGIGEARLWKRRHG